MTVDVIIPAHNESGTIEGVLEAVRGSEYVGHVIVVADNCDDATHVLAMQYTSSVLPAHFSNKGSSMAMGLDYVHTPYVAFCDADLEGLRSDHIDELCSLENKGQTAGLFSWNNMKLPPITGQRCLPTEVAKRSGLFGSGWEAEHRINATVSAMGLPWKHFHLDGVKHPSKLSKYDPMGWSKTMGQVALAMWKYGPELFNYSAYPEGRVLDHMPRLPREKVSR